MYHICCGMQNFDVLDSAAPVRRQRRGLLGGSMFDSPENSSCVILPARAYAIGGISVD